MAFSGAERAQRYREKKKTTGLINIVKKKDRLRKQVARSKMNSHQLAAVRLRQRVNLQRFRSKNKLTPKQLSVDSSFSTKQAKGKALKKVRKVLPKNEDKKTELVRQLATDLGIVEEKSLPTSSKKSINDYYFRDDISHQAPGTRDFITVNEDGKKQRLQKRYLLYSLREVYHLFIEEHPNIPVSCSAFTELRPSNVLYKSMIPHNVCVCMYHENIRLLLKALREHIDSFTSLDLQSFVQLLVCADTNELCMFRKCDQCEKRFDEMVKKKIIDENWLID